MRKFQEGKKYVFVAKKVKNRNNNHDWKMNKLWANKLNGREVQNLIDNFEGKIDTYYVIASWCKEVR